MTESPNGHLPENVARSFAEQMLNALACAELTAADWQISRFEQISSSSARYCHSMGIVHRDVKLEAKMSKDEASMPVRIRA